MPRFQIPGQEHLRPRTSTKHSRDRERSKNLSRVTQECKMHKRLRKTKSQTKRSNKPQQVLSNDVQKKIVSLGIGTK